MNVMKYYFKLIILGLVDFTYDDEGEKYKFVNY